MNSRATADKRRRSKIGCFMFEENLWNGISRIISGYLIAGANFQLVVQTRSEVGKVAKRREPVVKNFTKWFYFLGGETNDRETIFSISSHVKFLSRIKYFFCYVQFCLRLPGREINFVGMKLMA